LEHYTLDRKAHSQRRDSEANAADPKRGEANNETRRCPSHNSNKRQHHKGSVQIYRRARACKRAQSSHGHLR
jgi:hypothetical protein